MKNPFTPFLLIILALFCLAGTTAAEPGDTGEYLAFDFTGSLTANLDYPMLSGQPEPKGFYDEIRGALDYRSPWFDVLMDWGLRNDGKYTAEEKYLGGRYFQLHDTRIFLHSPDGVFALTAGKGPHKDVVDTPYSVYINSSDIPAVHLEFTYDNDFFFFTNRWVQLNYNSAQGYRGQTNNPFGALGPDAGDVDPWAAWSPYDGTWLDKGANFKTYGIKVDDWRFGFQDVVIYLDRSFDAEYFLNPIPQYFVQLINSAAGRPWTQAGNAKSFMGFFADRSTGDSYAAAQFLIDDLNASFFPGFNASSAIKSKFAWSLGGWKDFSFGRVGFYHGGATKYTFEATYTAHHYDIYADNPGFIDIPYSILPYESTYAPATEYVTEAGDTMAVDYTTNYFGYKYGENNIAFLVDYQNRFFSQTPYEFGLYSSLEWVLNGAKSPANPWHEYYSGSQIEDKILLLDGTVEHILRLSAALRKPLGRNFIVNLDLIGGVAINAMALVSVAPVDSDKITYDGSWEEPKIYVPQNGVVEPLLKVTLGGTWHIPVKNDNSETE